MSIFIYLFIYNKTCIKYNNFFSFFSIVAGLNLTPVSRLKKTWDVSNYYKYKQEKQFKLIYEIFKLSGFI